MQYKLLLVRNRFTEKIKIQEGLDWFKANTPLEMVTEELITDFDVTTEKISNATYSGVICGDDIYPKLRSKIPEGKYNAVVFMYGNDLAGIRVNVSKVLPLYPGTDLIQLCQTTDGGKALNHEIFHTFIHRLQRQQVMVEDPMDSVIVDGIVRYYYNNEMLDAKPSNRSIAIERIAPYWDKVANILILNQTPPVVTPVPNKIVTLIRNWDNGVQTLGDLQTLGFACKTLERPWKNNQKNISCIPKGTYNCKRIFSLRFGYVYEIQGVLNRTGVLLHPGNYFFDVEGCILLGDKYGDLNKDAYADILNSKVTLKRFEDLLAGKEFTLKII